jgi:uncharacterized protein
MENNKPHIHLFSTRGGSYLYDVNTGMILNIPGPVYDLLKTGGKTVDPAAGEYVEKLKAGGFCSGHRVETIEHPADRILEFYLDRKLSSATMQVTQLCNFRCEYCCYSGAYETRTHSNKVMSWDTAQKGIDFLVDHSADSNRLSLGFYGGEPLLEPDLIGRCIEYAEKRTEGRGITFHVTTNGTLLTGDIVDFLFRHDVSITISLDGPRDVHDKNRKFAFNNCGTFDRIMENISLIRSKYPNRMDRLMFSTVIDPDCDISCTNEFFLGYGAVKDIFILPSMVSKENRKEDLHVGEDFRLKIRYEDFKMFLSKLGRLDGRHTSRFLQNEFEYLRYVFYSNRNRKSAPQDKGHHAGPCIPGAGRLFITADGSFFPCEKVNESSEAMRIGHVDSGFDTERIRTLMNIGRLTEAQCRVCFAFSKCSACAITVDAKGGLSAEKKKCHCVEIRGTLDHQLKDYCTLMELGCDMEKRSASWSPAESERK